MLKTTYKSKIIILLTIYKILYSFQSKILSILKIRLEKIGMTFVSRGEKMHIYLCSIHKSVTQHFLKKTNK